MTKQEIEKFKRIKQNIEIDKIKVNDLGGICPRQIEFYFDNIKIGYLRVRYGSITLCPSTFQKSKDKMIFDIDYWYCIYCNDFGDFGDGNFINEKQEINTILKCKQVLVDFYKNEYDGEIIIPIWEKIKRI